MKPILSLLFLLVILCFQAAAQCGVHCGTERWKVKALIDSTAGNIDSTVATKTIAWLRNQPRPSGLQDLTRAPGLESQTFKVKGRVIRFKKEDDKDFHVVIAQTNNFDITMVVERPHLNCLRAMTGLVRIRR
jgi:hypothetical protein